MAMTTITVIADHPSPAPPTPLARMRELVLAGTALVGIFVIGGGTWAAFAPLESAAVAPGTVAPASHRKTVQHLEGGIIADILVHDGEEVRTGQTLIRLDDTKARTTLAGLTAQLCDARAREARLQAERDGAAAIEFPADLLAKRGDPTVAAAIAGQEKIFETRHSLQASKVAAIRERINEVHEEIAGLQAEFDALDQRKALLQDEIGSVQALVGRGLERRPRLLELERDLADVEGKRGDTSAQIAKAKQTIAESEVDILSLQNDRQKEVADDLRDTETKRQQFQQQAQVAADVLARTEVKAPENGTVTDLRVHTLGGVIAPGDALLDLVPESDRLVVEAEVRPEDIDQVHLGLTAEVRLLPYKQRRTPPLDATVTYVSADRLVDKRTNHAYYAAKLRVDEKELAALGSEVKMVPGMPSEVMIKTGETTVALYALSPILDSFHRAFSEK
jgi:HlyD family secretion protein